MNETINLLKQDNQNITDILNNIYNAVSKLDQNVWSSPGKRKLVDEFIPYLNKKNSEIPTSLNKCTDVLIKALNDYITTNNIILQATENLIGSDVVGG